MKKLFAVFALFLTTGILTANAGEFTAASYSVDASLVANLDGLVFSDNGVAQHKNSKGIDDAYVSKEADRGFFVAVLVNDAKCGERYEYILLYPDIKNPGGWVTNSYYRREVDGKCIVVKDYPAQVIKRAVDILRKS